MRALLALLRTLPDAITDELGNRIDRWLMAQHRPIRGLRCRTCDPACPVCWLCSTRRRWVCWPCPEHRRAFARTVARSG